MFVLGYYLGNGRSRSQNWGTWALSQVTKTQEEPRDDRNTYVAIYLAPRTVDSVATRYHCEVLPRVKRRALGAFVLWVPSNVAGGRECVGVGRPGVGEESRKVLNI